MVGAVCAFRGQGKWIDSLPNRRRPRGALIIKQFTMGPPSGELEFSIQGRRAANHTP